VDYNQLIKLVADPDPGRLNTNQWEFVCLAKQ